MVFEDFQIRSHLLITFEDDVFISPKYELEPRSVRQPLHEFPDISSRKSLDNWLTAVNLDSAREGLSAILCLASNQYGPKCGLQLENLNVCFVIAVFLGKMSSFSLLQL